MDANQHEWILVGCRLVESVGISFLYLVDFAVDGEGGVPGDVLVLGICGGGEDGFPDLAIGAALDVVAAPGDVDDGAARGLDEAAGWCVGGKVFPSISVFAFAASTVPSGEPEFAVYKTEAAPGCRTLQSVVVKGPGVPAVQ